MSRPDREPRRPGLQIQCPVCGATLAVAQRTRAGIAVWRQGRPDRSRNPVLGYGDHPVVVSGYVLVGPERDASRPLRPRADGAVPLTCARHGLMLYSLSRISRAIGSGRRRLRLPDPEKRPADGRDL